MNLRAVKNLAERIIEKMMPQMMLQLVAVFLLSVNAKYIPGQNLIVDDRSSL